jgi:acyl carrier protein
MLDTINLADQVLLIVRRFAPGLPDTADQAGNINLRDAGLTSLGAVQVMLQIEAAFDLVFPDKALSPANFATVEAIARLIEQTRAG